MKAAIAAKVSEEAISSGVRVCTWGQDPRRVFSEVGRAVGRSQVSKLFCENKLVHPGFTPTPDPVIAQPQPTPQNETNPAGDVVVAKVVKVGSQATPDELSTLFKHEVIKEVDLPEGGVAGSQHVKLCLTAAVGADKTKRVWFHNTHAKSVSLPVGTFLGRGGPGAIVIKVRTKNYTVRNDAC